MFIKGFFYFYINRKVAYQNHQQSTGMNNQLRQVARSAQNNFGVWVRNATEKGRKEILVCSSHSVSF
jgi:hypothetical protein